MDAGGCQYFFVIVLVSKRVLAWKLLRGLKLGEELGMDSGKERVDIGDRGHRELEQKRG